MLSVLYQVAVINLSLLFFCVCLRLLVLMHPRYLQICRVLFLLLFLMHRVCLCHLLGVKTNFLVLWSICWNSSLVHFLSRVSYKRISPSVYLFNEILHSRVWSREFFSFVWDSLFSFISTCLMVPTNYCTPLEDSVGLFVWMIEDPYKVL